MIGLPRHLKIFASTHPCDMRKQARGLLALVQATTKRDADVAELYLFWNRNRNQTKVVYLDANGTCMFVKQLHRGSFAIDAKTDECATMVTISADTLAGILAAVDCLTRSSKQRKPTQSRTH